MRTLLAAASALFVLAGSALAQNALETQAPVPLGGNDTRSLPARESLPPMFGSNLFTRFPPGQRGGPQPTAGVNVTPSPRGGATPTGGTAGAAGGGGNAAQDVAALAAGVAAAAGAQGGATGGQNVAAMAAGGGGQQSNTIPGTGVQPPPGITAFDPNHIMAPGDVVQIHIYGATTLDQQVTVDSNGDIFLPTIGPVHVAGTLAGNLDALVTSAISSVYQSNAQVYVTLASAVPLNVFVTGEVVSPGQYALPSTASIITFLQTAGGIDPNRGSYRNIQVVRDGRTISHFDLYDFLLRGRSPQLRLRERDTILVGPQGPAIAAMGDVAGVFRYELTRPENGRQLTALARPFPDATRIHLVGIRAGRPAAFDYSLSEFSTVAIHNGDVVTYSPDVPTNVMSVKFEGRLDGPTSMVVSRQATLYDVLPYVSIDPHFADSSGIYVRRVSVAQAQLKAIQDSMQRLKAAVVTSPTITSEQAQMQQEEAKVIFQFSEQLSNVKPEGRLVVSHQGHLQNVRLEDGDVVVVPSVTDLVLVSGEVRTPQAVVWTTGAPVEHYIRTAGGFTERANEDKLLVIRPSGETIVNTHPPIQAGDRIIVLPAPSSWTLPLIKDITQILYQVAVTTGVALNLK